MNYPKKNAPTLNLKAVSHKVQAQDTHADASNSLPNSWTGCSHFDRYLTVVHHMPWMRRGGNNRLHFITQLYSDWPKIDEQIRDCHSYSIFLSPGLRYPHLQGNSSPDLRVGAESSSPDWSGKKHKVVSTSVVEMSEELDRGRSLSLEKKYFSRIYRTAAPSVSNQDRQDVRTHPE